MEKTKDNAKDGWVEPAEDAKTFEKIKA